MMDDTPYKFSRSKSEIDPQAIAQRSPISIDGLSLILDAPGIDLVIPDRETACLMLAVIADEVVWAAVHGRRATKPELDAVVHGLDALLKAVSAIEFTTMPPPDVPLSWVREMTLWTAMIDRQLPTKSRPEKLSDRTAYTLLLAFYIVAFGQQPGSSEAGPAARFVATFFRELRQALVAAEWVNPSKSLPDLDGLISDLAPAAIRSRLRTFIPEVDRLVPMVRELGENVARSLGQDPPQMGGG